GLLLALEGVAGQGTLREDHQAGALAGGVPEARADGVEVAAAVAEGAVHLHARDCPLVHRSSPAVYEGGRTRAAVLGWFYEPAGPDRAARPAGLPERLGRYRLTAQLGAGGFGVVYRAYDDDLRREVAIKVPHAYRVAAPADVEAYLHEARVLASLDHPAIVPV